MYTHRHTQHVRYFLLALVAFASTLLTACGGSGFYHNDAAMEFQDFDYGVPTTSTEINGTLLSWYDSGGKGTPLLLVHGLASNAGFWRSNIGPLRDAGFRVIAVDLPGYGKSGKPWSAPYSMEWFAETLERLLDHLALKKAVFVGHSMGAQISLTAALRSSDRVAALVLLSPAGIESFKRGEGDWLKNSVTPEFVISTPQDRVRANLVSNFYSWRDEFEWMVEERMRMSKARDFDRFAYAVSRSVAAMVDGPVWQRLGDITVPTLIVYGENDNLIPNPYLHGGRTASVMEWGASRIPSARLIEIPCAGHMVQLEAASAVNNAIIDFVKKD